MIWPWQRERRARLAELAALGASVEDERLDPDRILAAAAGEYESMTGYRNGEDVQELRDRFGSAPVAVLLHLRSTLRRLTYSPDAAPSEITVQVRRNARMEIVDFRVAPDGGRAEAAVEVTARVRSWIGRHGYLPARVLSGTGPYGGGEYPAARSRRLHALWIYELAGSARGWRFVRFESMSSGAHRYERPLETTAEDHLGIRDELVLRDAADDVGGLRIPLEVAQSLPYDATAALRELTALDESFQAHVLEAAVREILSTWAAASEGAGSLDGVASDGVARRLLNPPGTVLRGPELMDVKPLRVRAIRVPPEITVELDVRAYIGAADPEDARHGSIRRRHRLWWRLARQDSAALPWRLVDAEVDPSRP